MNWNADLFRSFISRDEAVIWVQCPIRLLDNGEPEPDIALLRPRPDLYRDSLPTNHDALLLVEVSNTTLRFDRNVKLPLYAVHGIPELWLVNLRDDVVEVYRNPEGGAYRETLRLSRGDGISPLAFPDVALAVGDILG